MSPEPTEPKEPKEPTEPRPPTQEDPGGGHGPDEPEQAGG